MWPLGYWYLMILLKMDQKRQENYVFNIEIYKISYF